MNRFAVLMLAGVLVVAGCKDDPRMNGRSSESKTTSDDSDVQSNLDQLSPDDRAIASAQKSCPIANEPLGSMGVPMKVMIKEQPVFICCKSCEKGAKRDPDKTLATVKELKTKNAVKDR